MRQELRLALSQSLFSSFDVDVGTRLLLKTIAKEVDLQAVQSALDVGCGVGTLGLAVKKAAPHIALTVQDRDALAVAFTQMNARRNKIGGVTAVAGLAFQYISGSFDLILSNLPGKAGQPVLRHMLAQMAGQLTERGLAAIVIVNPLADWLANTLQQQGSVITFTERGKGHTVFHFRGGEGQPPIVEQEADLLHPYMRGQFPFKMGKQTFTLRTVYNLPEFDTLGHQTTLALSLLKNEQVSGRVLVWNPGQGHMPLYLHRQFGQKIEHMTLAGRDALSLENGRANLIVHGANPAQLTLHHIPTIQDLPGSYDWVIAFPEADPGVPWEDYLWAGLSTAVSKPGHLLLTAKSSFIFRLLAVPHPFHKKNDRKKHGYRALLLKST
ncbi:MAG: methyltransferase [Ardenticatenaceae bacterium]|nr:methyltransferase [Ardenticatenaceae bacterium]